MMERHALTNKEPSESPRRLLVHADRASRRQRLAHRSVRDPSFKNSFRLALEEHIKYALAGLTPNNRIIDGVMRQGNPARGVAESRNA